MSTIADKLNKALANKADIKAALIEKGRTPSDNMSTYGDEIRAIETGGSNSALNDGVTSLTLTFEEDGELIEMSLPIIYKYFGDVDPGLDRLRLDMFGADATVPFFYMLTMLADEVDIPSLLNTFTDPSIFVDMIKRASNVHSILMDAGDIQEYILKSCLIHDRSDYPIFGKNKVYVYWSFDLGGGDFYEAKIEFDKDTDRWENQWVKRFDTNYVRDQVGILKSAVSTLEYTQQQILDRLWALENH
jgi:hypothetical protein